MDHALGMPQPAPGESCQHDQFGPLDHSIHPLAPKAWIPEVAWNRHLKVSFLAAPYGWCHHQLGCP